MFLCIYYRSATLLSEEDRARKKKKEGKQNGNSHGASAMGGGGEGDKTNKISMMGLVISVKKNNLGKGMGMTGGVLI